MTKSNKFPMFRLVFFFMTAIYALTWAIVIYVLFTDGAFYEELLRYTSVLYGAVFGSYCCKTAYEHKADKIEAYGKQGGDSNKQYE